MQLPGQGQEQAAGGTRGRYDRGREGKLRSEGVEVGEYYCSSLDKAKNRLQGELEDVMIEVERVSY